jgi:hypothetical protein
MQTYKTMFCAVAIALCAAPIAAMAADPRPCELFSTKEIASVIGVTPERGRPSEPDVDKDLAATSWTCSWSVGKRDFIAAVVRFRSAADATRELTSVMHTFMAEDDLPKLSEVPGPGEQNFWKSKSRDGFNSGTWVSRKGQTVLGVVVVLVGVKQPESLREPLRDLVASGLRRLP